MIGEAISRRDVSRVPTRGLGRYTVAPTSLKGRNLTVLNPDSGSYTIPG